MKKLLLIALLGPSSLLFPQTVCTGNVEHCREAQKVLCAKEIAPANLELSISRTVVGTVADQSGAKFDGIAVQLRLPGSSQPLQSVPVNQGHFTLGELSPGSYRLIVVKAGPAGPERLKMFDQPKDLTCPDSGPQCRLTVVPKAMALIIRSIIVHRNDEKWQAVLKGHGLSRAEKAQEEMGL